MKTKYAFLALVVGVLMGTMAFAALADDSGMNMYGPGDSSISATPENGSGTAESGEIREPVEAGAVPSEVESPSDPSFGCCSGDREPTYEYGGVPFRHGLDDGP